MSKLRDPAVTSGHASIEARLQEIEQEAKTYGRGRQELAAVRCYITRCESKWRNVTGGITNHLSLLREIERLNKTEEPVCLVTFNYDTLLEAALADLGLEIKDMDDYTRRPTLFRLFKLHGSVDWGRRVEVAFPANLNPGDSHAALKYLVEHGSEGKITNHFARCDPATMRPPGEPDTPALFPAIAIPVEKKQVFECPDYMIEELKRTLHDVTKLLVIGWRATEDHFLDLLNKHLQWGRRPYVSIVSANQTEAQQTGDRIHEALSYSSSLSGESAAGFTEFMRSGRPQQILGR